MSGQRQNWVTALAKCTLEHNFGMVADAIREDVRQFNSLKPEARGERLFIVEDRGPGIAILHAHRVDDLRGPGGKSVIADPAYGEDFVSVAPDRTLIVAQRQDFFALEVFPKWNEDTLECDLVIDDQAYPVWNISQKILREFLFGR